MYFSKVFTIILVIILALFGLYGKSEKRSDFCATNLYCSKVKSSGEYFKIRLDSSLPPVHGALATGILFGDDSKLPKDLKKLFREVGLSHITAASGSNVSLIVIPLTFLFSMMPIIKSLRTIMIILTLGWYAVVSGMDPPIIRATLLASVTLISLVLNQYVNNRNIILLSAVLMSVFNPSLLRESIGFQLSFMALIGIIYGGEFIKRLKVKHEWVKNALEFIGPTFFAFIFTAPIILQISGKLSFISIPLNIIVTPLIPLIMIFGLAVLIWPPLANAALYQSVDILIKEVKFFSEHNILLEVSVNFWLVLIMYVILFTIFFRLWWPNYHKNLSKG